MDLSISKSLRHKLHNDLDCTSVLSLPGQMNHFVQFCFWRCKGIIEVENSITNEVVGGYILILNLHGDGRIVGAIEPEFIIPFWGLSSFLMGRTFVDLWTVAEFTERILNKLTATIFVKTSRSSTKDPEIGRTIIWPGHPFMTGCPPWLGHPPWPWLPPNMLMNCVGGTAELSLSPDMLVILKTSRIRSELALHWTWIQLRGKMASKCKAIESRIM